MRSMNLSNNGLELIKSFEGLSLKAYQCTSGKWTIGYGHTLGVKQNDIITKEMAENYLLSDVSTFENIINRVVTKEITQNQFDSLVSFTFNVGQGNLLKSTLLKYVNLNPQDSRIRDEFLKWIYSGGKVSEGLRKRREKEANLYVL